MKIPIIYEDKDIIVVDKPAGLLVHPTKQKEKETLTNILIKHHPLLKNVGENRLRPGIVHRLDKDTSGLMIIAKNNKTFFYLKKQFQNRKIEKKYLALAIGKLKEKRGMITKAIGRSRKKGIKQTVTPVVPRKEAVTEYKVLKEYKNYSLVEAIPKTGRMHQIRVHFASIGHPVAGDKLYGFKRQPCPKGLKRQFLHANYLKFSLPSGEIKEFRSELSEELKLVIRKLENSNRD